ncbi:hypothetical protein N9V56_01715 [Alphaproteobacteria bacterium]|nr:hypothetical protein [Alphaproteobacteria bacterium]
MFILNKRLFIDNILILFFLAFIVRLIFIFFQNPSPDKLIEDELLYWNASINYLNDGSLEDSISAERMLGVFIYIKMLLLLSFQNLKIYFVFQSIIDALTCLIIYKTGSLILPKQKIYIYLSALFSPLMIILSSQVLSETIFLFFFSIFLYFSTTILLEKKFLYLKTLMAGLFLGLSTSIRSITYPLLLLSIFPLIIIFLKLGVNKFKILISCLIFLFFALLPISSRLYQNIYLYNSYAITSQGGTHLAYWVAPSILTHTNNISRTEAIKLVDQVAKKYHIPNDYFEKDKVLRKVGLEVLSQVNKYHIAIHWVKASIINLLAPSILLDKTLRALPHPSYYETGNILLWMKIIFSNSEYYSYLLLISIASITSIFTLISLLVGSLYMYQNNKTIFYLIMLYMAYFLVITGPVLSPKYIFPILPCIFLYQGITFYKVIYFIKGKLKVI